MDAGLSAWFVILLAVIAANLPFLNERLLAVLPLKFSPDYSKPFWLRLLELIALYFLVGACAWLLESRIGNVFSQGWEFYAITGCLFIVLAYPGFVFRYLRRHRG